MKTKNTILSVAFLVFVVIAVMLVSKKRDVPVITENSQTPAESVAQADQTQKEVGAPGVSVSTSKNYESKEFGVRFQYPKDMEVQNIRSTPKVLLSVSVLYDNSDIADKDTFSAAYPAEGEPTLEEIRKKALHTEVKIGSNTWYRFYFPEYNKDTANYVLEKNGIEYSYNFRIAKEDTAKKILSTMVFTVPTQ